MDNVLHELSTRNAIRERLHDYCRAMDRIDRDLGRSVWHADGTADYGAIFRGLGSAFVDWVSDQHERKTGHSHQLASIGIRVTAATAASEAYVTAVLHDETQRTEVRGRYLDRWAFRAGEWRIDHRLFVQDLVEARPLGDVAMPTGTRDRDDPSYLLLG